MLYLVLRIGNYIQYLPKNLVCRLNKKNKNFQGLMHSIIQMIVGYRQL